MTVPADAPGADPLVVFRAWRAEADGAMAEPDAIALGTATAHGVPSVRFVLMRAIGDDAVSFYTNYRSRKGAELAENPRAAIAWFDWVHRRQVRVTGQVAELAGADSDAYFAQRDRGHQLGAHASVQSAPLESRAQLEEAYTAAEERFSGREVDRPAHWGGYLVRAEVVELWIQRPDRLHDRFEYVREDGLWAATRLSP